jgi:uncharacterized membrane protein/protein-disulfide isomerase
MTTKTRNLLLLFALVGLVAAAVSTNVHYKLLTEPGTTSFCDVNTAMNCSQAFLSQYGSFLGVPVAIPGMLFFALVLAIVGIAGRTASGARENVPGYVFALSTLALAFVLYLGWASYVVLKTFCILCAITYVSVIAIFIISSGATTFPMTALPGRARRDIRTLLLSPLALAVALLLAGAATMFTMSFPKEPVVQAKQDYPPVPADKIPAIAQWWAMQPKVELPVPSGGAKVLVVKFSDYQCPACKLTHEGYKDILAKYGANGSVRYVLKHFPLEPECNPAVPDGNHYASCEAAAAVIMARSKGTATKMEDWIFTNIGPPALTPAQVKDAARTVGGIQDFDAQYANALLEVKTDAGMGQLLKVGSTPTFYINGRKVPEIVSPPVFELLIELELKQAK